jgi:hypothetical protein
MKKKFTAVEQLDILLLGVISFDSEALRSKYKEALSRAIAMEKEQIIEAYENGEAEWTPFEFKTAQDYYTSTFGS